MSSIRALAVVPLALGLAAPVAPVHAAPQPWVEQASASEPSSKPAKPRRAAYREYVALGDSWTANVVLLNRDGLPDTTYAPIDCAQSHRNYPKLVRGALGIKRFRDASCGSATTDDFRNPQTGLPAGGTNSPQFGRLSRRTDLVTVGVGGNDAGIAAAGIACLNLLPFENPLPTDQVPLPDLPIPIIGSNLPLGGCKDAFTAGGKDRLSRSIKASESKVIKALRGVHRRSPQARVLVVDYLDVVPPKACYPLVPATNEDIRYFRAKFRELNAMLARAARRGGAEIVRTKRISQGHDLCSGSEQRYAEVLGASVNDPAVGIPAHPNAAGARAQARAVLQYLRKHP